MPNLSQTTPAAPSDGGGRSLSDAASPESPEPRSVILIAVAMTALAELIYLAASGILMFPGGDPAAMIVWTVTCAVAIGATVGAAVSARRYRRFGRPHPRLGGLRALVLAFAEAALRRTSAPGIAARDECNCKGEKRCKYAT